MGDMSTRTREGKVRMSLRIVCHEPKTWEELKAIMQKDYDDSLRRHLIAKKKFEEKEKEDET